MTNPQKPVILSGWERGKRNLRNTRQACRLCDFALTFSRFRKLARSRLHFVLRLSTSLLHLHPLARPSLLYFSFALRRRRHRHPFCVGHAFRRFWAVWSNNPPKGLNNINLFCADLLTHPSDALIIDAYLGDIMEKAKKPLEPTKSALVREVEAKLGFKKFELNSLERANKATIVALLVR